MTDDKPHPDSTVGRDTKGEPLTAGKAMALTREERAEIDGAEATLRNEISRFLDKSRAMEQALNEAMASLRRQTVKPMLDHFTDT